MNKNVLKIKKMRHCDGISVYWTLPIKVVLTKLFEKSVLSSMGLSSKNTVTSTNTVGKNFQIMQLIEESLNSEEPCL